MIRQNDKVISIPSEPLEAWSHAKGILKEAKACEDSAKATVMAALGDAEVGINGNGDHVVTYFEQERKGYEVKAASYRVLRQKKGKPNESSNHNS